MKLKDFHTLKELAEYVGLTEVELWRVICGKKTRNFDAARRLSEVSGVKDASFIFNETKKARPGFISWLSAKAKVSKTEIWQLLREERLLPKSKLDGMAVFFDIPVDDWSKVGPWPVAIYLSRMGIKKTWEQRSVDLEKTNKAEPSLSEPAL